MKRTWQKVHRIFFHLWHVDWKSSERKQVIHWKRTIPTMHQIHSFFIYLLIMELSENIFHWHHQSIRAEGLFVRLHTGAWCSTACQQYQPWNHPLWFWLEHQCPELFKFLALLRRCNRWVGPPEPDLELQFHGSQLYGVCQFSTSPISKHPNFQYQCYSGWDVLPRVAAAISIGEDWTIGFTVECVTIAEQSGDVAAKPIVKPVFKPIDVTAELTLKLIIVATKYINVHCSSAIHPSVDSSSAVFTGCS